MLKIKELQIEKYLTIPWIHQRRQIQKFFQEIKQKYILTLEETALYIECDLMTIVEAVLEGKLKAGKIGDKWYINKKNIETYLAHYKQERPLSFPIATGGIKYEPSPPELVTNFKELYQLGERDFTGVNIIRANLSYLFLSESDLESAILINTDFSHSDLSLCFLRDANLTYANLGDANLTNSELQFCDLSFANLSNADLTKTNLYGANLTGANLSGAKLDGTVF